MTWSARITKADGTVDGYYMACHSCIHGKGTCYLPKVVYSVANLLTSVDTGSDGHMASGSADLKCNGYEQEPEPEPEEAA